MSKPGNDGGYVLPDIVDPPRKCIQFHIPDEPHHIAAFFGALLDLAMWFNWQRDDAHTGKDVAKVWFEVFNEASDAWLVGGRCCEQPPTVIEEFEYQMSICEQLRFQNGVLQGLCCGEWVDIAGQPPNGIGGGGQPGNGSPQPTPTHCQLYHGVMGASAPWYLPTVVSSGDTLELSAVTGLWNDGNTAQWRDYKGDLSFAGNNVGNPITVGTDPMPAEPHEALICVINGTYYNLSSGILTVPGGVSNAQVTLQMNDAPTANNGGELDFNITVCNNQAVNWTSVLDFRLGPYSALLSGIYGTWVPGSGYEGVANGTSPSYVQFDINTGAFQAESLDFTYNIASVGGSGAGVDWYIDGTQVAASPTPIAGGDQHFSYVASTPVTTGILPVIADGPGGGAAVIRQVTIVGSGPKPAVLP